MNSYNTTITSRWINRFVSTLLGVFIAVTPCIALAADDVGEKAKNQIAALLAEKEARTPAQKKMDSQLVYLVKQSRNEMIAHGLSAFKPSLDADEQNRVLVDFAATVSPKLLDAITQNGGTIVNHFAAYNSIRALVPVAAVETLAARADVRSISPAAQAMTNLGTVLSEGDRTHRADTARATFSASGSGVKVGVLSDGVNSLAASITNGNLNSAASSLSGQAGSGDEGTAMMEIVQDLVPDAELIFATAFNGDASFATNILALQAAGCTVIVDDVTYFNESPFQDGIISQAVNTVSDAGVLFFSSARNSGNKNDGTSGTWEGDFVSGGVVAGPISGSGNLLDFGSSTTFNTVAPGGSSRRVDFFWADPAGASTNDYDIFVLDSTGASVLRSSTNVQSGTQNPYEAVSTLNVGERIVVVQRPGAANRFLHLDTGRAVLTISTEGNVRGHNASGAANAFSVAATNVANSPSPNFFVGGATNPVETFSSDGPRRMFFDPSGTPFTPGNFTATGGTVLNKPDITAADGGATSVPGFTTFFGTSAAAPHAAAIAALLQSYNPNLTASQIRTLMTSTALDIEATGNDRDSGSGIVMALAAIQAAPAPDALTIISTGLTSSGPQGGPFSPSSGTYTLTNNSLSSIDWTAAKTQSWTTLSSTGGTLAPGANTVVTCSINDDANPLAVGLFSDTVTITNTTSGFVRNFNDVSLTVIDGVSGTGFGTIPDGTAGTAPSFGAPLVISFPVSGIAGDLTNVTIEVSLTHPWSGDVDLVLSSPGGTRSMVLVSRLGATTAGGFGSSSDYNGTYTFTDSAAGANIWTAAVSTPIPSGEYRTTGAGGAGQTNPPAFTSLVATFGGLTPAEANGTWTLSARDAASVDIGSISAAMLHLTAPVPPEIVVEDASGADIPDNGSDAFGNVAIGSNSSRTFTIRNTGSGNLTGLTITKDGTHASDFTVTANPTAPVLPGESTVFTVQFTPGAPGIRTAAIHIANNDSDENPFDIQLSGTGITSPEIAVERSGGTNVPDGGPAVPFGAPLVGSSSSHTFTIRNTGNANLTGIVISKDGTNAADFTVSAHPSTAAAPGATIAPGGFATFSVTFSPSSAGLKTAAIRIASNDADENPYDIALVGSGIGPEIDVERSGGTIVSDGGPAVPFGAPVLGSSSRHTFTIRNTGNANLTGIVISKDGTNAADFTISAHPSTAAAPGATIAPGGFATFTVTYSPSSVGLKTAAIRIASNDLNENPYDIAVAGSSRAPEIAVEREGGLDLADGGPAVSFGSPAVGGNSRQVFTIRNTGNANLLGIVIGKDGTHAADFTISANPITVAAPGGIIVPGGMATFAVTFTPSSSGLKTAAIRIASNDPDENPFDIQVSGTGIAPEIAVERAGGLDLADGGPAVPFGNLTVGGGTRQTFTIRNPGNVNLTGIVISKVGANAVDYTVTSHPSTTVAPGGAVAPGGFATFTVDFHPTTAGVKTATIRIASNDADENPFDIPLTGTGISARFTSAMNAKSAVMDSTSQPLKVQGKRTFTPVDVGAAGKVLAYTIQLPENTPVDSVKIRMVGEDASNYQLITPSRIQPSRDGRLTFQVAFHPLTPGTKNASIRISGIRPDGKFVRRVKLTGKTP